MSEYPYNFDAKVQKYLFSKMHYTVVYVPKSITSKLDFSKSKRLRIDGEINGIRIDAALMPAKGKWYIMVSKKLLKLCGLEVGQVASVAFDIADQNAVSIPIELQFALDADDDAAAAWEKLTAGKRRGLAYRVASAKMPETRERRVEEVLEFLR